MTTSILLAKLLGVYCIVVALGILLNPSRMDKLLVEYTKSTLFLYFGGILALFFGLLVVLFHNIWTGDWRVIITFFGWMGILKGCLLLMFPETMLKLVKKYQDNPNIYYVQISLVLVVGIYLTFVGFTGSP